MSFPDGAFAASENLNIKQSTSQHKRIDLRLQGDKMWKRCTHMYSRCAEWTAAALL